MNCKSIKKIALSAFIASSQIGSLTALADDASLRGPIDAKSNAQAQPVTVNQSTAPQVPQIPATQTTRSSEVQPIGGLSAPGADAMMTPDLLLVKPSGDGKKPPEPLKAYVNMGLDLHVDRRDIAFQKLHGVMITISNQTNRPLVLDGEKAVAKVGPQQVTAIPIVVLQKAVLPPTGLEHAIESIGTTIIPAAVTIGAYPTVKDEIAHRKPVLKRYGPDEKRREVEASRFGRRILWPHERTQGILYFQTAENLEAAEIQVPATTLFDVQDTCMLSSAPVAAQN